MVFADTGKITEQGRVRHDRIHNLYGCYMTRAAAEAFERFVPEKRMLLFSRSSYIGMHRYGGIWTGDNRSWWQQLSLSIRQMPSLNMCGLLYSGSDIGGFGDDTTEDLMLRWMEFGIFTPLMRNHASMGTRKQEVYQFKAVEDFRNLIRLRYALLPYLYSEFVKAALEDEMYFRPLAFDYPKDAQAVQVEDQLMVGGSVMIAPVYQQNALGRYVYLPEHMLMIRVKAPEDLRTIPHRMFISAGRLLACYQPIAAFTEAPATGCRGIMGRRQWRCFGILQDSKCP